MAQAFLNGAFVDRVDARLSAFDAGVQHGVGLFETMLGVAGDEEPARIIGLREHMERLAESARTLQLSDDLRTEALADAALDTFVRSGLDRARLRLTITGGDLNLLEREGSSNHTPSVLIVAQPATAYPAEMFERGVRVSVADSKPSPFDPTAGHKTLNYWWRLRELQAAAAKGAGESLVFQVSNHLVGGCVSNAIALSGGRAVTPICRGEEAPGGLPSPSLPGVTRGVVLGWLEDAGVEIHRQMVTIGDVLDAEELVLTNSSWGVLPVVGVESKDIGAGRPGPIGSTLVERWRAFVSG